MAEPQDAPAPVLTLAVRHVGDQYDFTLDRHRPVDLEAMCAAISFLLAILVERYGSAITVSLAQDLARQAADMRIQESVYDN